LKSIKELLKRERENAGAVTASFADYFDFVEKHKPEMSIAFVDIDGDIYIESSNEYINDLYIYPEMVELKDEN